MTATPAERQARRRKRARCGRIVVAVEVSDDVTAALIASGRLSEGDAKDRERIGAALSSWLSASLEK